MTILITAMLNISVIGLISHLDINFKIIKINV